VLTRLGAIAGDTGIFPGRSPADKDLVRADTPRAPVWWCDRVMRTNDNQPRSQETWPRLLGLVTAQLSGRRLG
ncbi:phosphoenolpyruvate carboxykinase (ATP), partial [Klebsiella quasipneumoniae]|uniref:phosphoenolpyruvate carboxykinase (ATP) n=1 Tax=Klebsiella quasipneumoniae TaxID=1463165 RepID=UPI0011125880